MLFYDYTGLEAKYNDVFKWTILIIQDVIMALIKLNPDSQSQRCRQSEAYEARKRIKKPGFKLVMDYLEYLTNRFYYPD